MGLRLRYFAKHFNWSISFLDKNDLWFSTCITGTAHLRFPTQHATYRCTSVNWPKAGFPMRVWRCGWTQCLNSNEHRKSQIDNNSKRRHFGRHLWNCYYACPFKLSVHFIFHFFSFFGWNKFSAFNICIFLDQSYRIISNQV